MYIESRARAFKRRSVLFILLAILLSKAILVPAISLISYALIKLGMCISRAGWWLDSKIKGKHE